MKASLYILFGAVLTVATATALGGILLRALSIKLFRFEERLLGFVTGSACLSGLMFLLCATHLIYKGVLLGLAALILGIAFRAGLHRPALERLPPLPRIWTWVFLAAFSVFSFLYFFNAMAPEMSPDGSAYHLPLIAKYYHAHGFVRITSTIYANISQGVELLFLFAYGFGRYSAAALVHFAFLIALPLLMLSYARRFGFTLAGLASALFVFASPVVGMDGTTAYIDVALAAVVFAMFYLLQIWAESDNDRLLVPVGLLAGFSFAVKYTACIAIPFVLGFVLWKRWRRRSAGAMAAMKPALAVLGLALLFVLPWTLKNWIWIGNPVTPFANRIFANPYVHVSFEEDYRRYQRDYGITGFQQFARELTVGHLLIGVLGPLYLLTPLSLLAVRRQQGRQLLLAGAVFALPYLANIGTRFLIPALPFFSLALGIALMRFPILLMALAMTHAIASWPDVLKLYCSQYSWRLNDIPVTAALRMESEDSFLSRNFAGYITDRMIEREVPAGEKVLCMGQIAEAYTTRPILVRYLAAKNETLGDMLLSAIYHDWQPIRLLTFRLTETVSTKIRIVQTARSKEAIWSISELRVYDRGKELDRAPGWRLTAHPNPWDVQLAFDNDPITRWRSWQAIEPGMYVTIDFGVAQKLDSVSVLTPPDFQEPAIHLEVTDAAGKWIHAGGQPTDAVQPVTVGLRRAATTELKVRGIHYILIGYDDLGSEDFYQHSSVWGVRLVGDQGYTRLYHIE